MDNHPPGSLAAENVSGKLAAGASAGFSGDSADATQLQALLSAELGTLRALDADIDAEFAALSDSRAEELEAVTNSKINAVDAHRGQQLLRLEWMRTKGFTEDLGLADLVSQFSSSSELHQLQLDLSELAADCQEKNRRNGVLITRLQARTQGALDVLRGDTGRSSDIYSLSGAKESAASGRSLGKA